MILSQHTKHDTKNRGKEKKTTEKTADKRGTRASSPQWPLSVGVCCCLLRAIEILHHRNNLLFPHSFTPGDTCE